MELRQLRYFAAVAREGSFVKAASAVYVAQSALSHQVAQLEAELGATLFHRLPRGIALTESGLAFLPHALSILRQADDARRSVSGALDQPTGKVVFGLPPSICGVFALPLLQAVRRDLPTIDLELTEELSGSLAAELRAGTLDLAVLLDDGTLSQYQAWPLLREQLFLVSSPHRKDVPRGSSVSFRKAMRLPLLLPRPRQGVRPIIDAVARREGVTPPDDVGEINSVSILRSTLLAGIGHTIQAPSAFKTELEAGILHGSPIRSPDLHRNLAICASRQVPLSAGGQAMLALARRVVRELLASGAWPSASWIDGLEPEPDRPSGASQDSSTS